MRSSPPLDLVVLTLRNRGASPSEIARQVGLSEREVEGSLQRVTSRFGAGAASRESVRAPGRTLA
jgi:hypothetical protein